MLMAVYGHLGADLSETDLSEKDLSEKDLQLAYHKSLTSANSAGQSHMLMSFTQKAYTTQSCPHSVEGV